MMILNILHDAIIYEGYSMYVKSELLGHVLEPESRYFVGYSGRYSLHTGWRHRIIYTASESTNLLVERNPDGQHEHSASSLCWNRLRIWSGCGINSGGRSSSHCYRTFVAKAELP